MTPEEHVEQAVLQHPALEEALHALDATHRAAVLQAITCTVREAKHAERRECARIAVAYMQAHPDPAHQALAEEIATEILARDTDARQPEPS
jgi:hypothetical protein